MTRFEIIAYRWLGLVILPAAFWGMVLWLIF
jgi:hypothetical protein